MPRDQVQKQILEKIKKLKLAVDRLSSGGGGPTSVTIAGPNPLPVIVTNQVDLSTMEGTLSSILTSVQGIDANTDTVESILSNILTAIGNLDQDDDGTALAAILTELNNVVTELQSVDANTDNLESSLANILAEVTPNATETKQDEIIDALHGTQKVTNLNLSSEFIPSIYPFIVDEIEMGFTDSSNDAIINPPNVVINNNTELAVLISTVTPVVFCTETSNFNELQFLSGTLDIHTINYLGISTNKGGFSFLEVNFSDQTSPKEHFEIVEEQLQKMLDIAETNAESKISVEVKRFTPNSFPLTSDEVDFTSTIYNTPSVVLNNVNEVKDYLNKYIPDYYFEVDGNQIIVMSGLELAKDIQDVFMGGESFSPSNSLGEFDKELVKISSLQRIQDVLDDSGAEYHRDITLEGVEDIVTSGSVIVKEFSMLVIQGTASVRLANGSLEYAANSSSDRIEKLKNNRGIPNIRITPGANSIIRILYKIK